MKCEVVKDLLPLYIDGLTSAESNKEIEKHLKSCKECRKYYQEMTGELEKVSGISKEEIDEVEFIKKMKRRNKRRIVVFVSAAAVILIGVIAVLYPFAYSTVKYDDIKLTYGVRQDRVYMSMETKPGYEIYFNGSTTKEESYLKVMSLRKTFDKHRDIMNWEDELGTEKSPCRWRIEFSDKIIVIENGKLVEEKDK